MTRHDSGPRGTHTDAELGDSLASVRAPPISRRDFHSQTAAIFLALLGAGGLAGETRAAAPAIAPSLAPDPSAGFAFTGRIEAPSAEKHEVRAEAAVVAVWLEASRASSTLGLIALDMISKHRGLPIAIDQLQPFLESSLPDVRKAALNVLERRPDVTAGYKDVEPHLRSSSAGEREMALKVLSARADIALPKDFMRGMRRIYEGRKGPIVNVEDALLDLIAARQPDGSLDFLRRNYLRASRNDGNLDIALEVIKAKSEMIERLPLLEIIRASAGLSERALEDANEQRLGQVLSRKLQRGLAESLKPAELDAIAMPVLHLLQKIDERFPGYLASLARGNGRMLTRFCEETARVVSAERAIEIAESRKGLKEEINLLVALHNQACFEPAVMRKRIEGLVRPGKSNLIGIFKSDLSEDDELMWLEAGIPAGDMFEKSAEKAKNGFLDGVWKVARERDVKGLVWCSGHGGSKHFWFSNGAWGDSERESLTDPIAVSYRELARTLVRAQLADKPDRPIDLSHLTIIQDACLQSNFIGKLHDEIFAEARKEGISVKGLPRLVAGSQRGLPSWIRGIGPESGSFLQLALGEANRGKRKTSSLERLIKADGILNRRLETELPQRDKRVVGEDLAIYSSRVQDIDELTQRIADGTEKRGQNLPALPRPRKMPEGRRKSLEIGMHYDRAKAELA